MKLTEVDSTNPPELKMEYIPVAEHLKAGMVSDHIYAYENGKKVGYLKIDRIDPKLFKEECPDLWSYKQSWEGSSLFPYGSESTPIQERSYEDLVKALRSGYLHRGISSSARQMGWDESDIKIIDQIANEYRLDPNEFKQYADLVKRFFLEWPNTRDGKALAKKVKDKLAYLTKPFVAYINTKENRHQGLDNDNSGRGIGTALYLAGSQWIRDRKLGKGLYASSVQSDDAKAIWSKFESKGMVAKDGERRYLKA